MDIMQAIIQLLRGKQGNEAVQADQSPEAMSDGVAAAIDPATAAAYREAVSMGEIPRTVTLEQYAASAGR